MLIYPGIASCWVRGDVCDVIVHSCAPDTEEADRLQSARSMLPQQPVTNNGSCGGARG